ncbi:hypothetical protein [uncultured Propionivibrio sp.]|uniref:hypothetical protein n=1 Tax=uncultured Propionivibrio sp. TaxID=426737 RepID=UPI0029C0E292|nr:hypothetical protein [uncultured Propionivibrio sp.]
MKRAKRRIFRRGIRDILSLLPKISNPALDAAIESASMGQDSNFVISSFSHPEIIAMSLGELAQQSERRENL